VDNLPHATASWTKRGSFEAESALRRLCYEPEARYWQQFRRNLHDTSDQWRLLGAWKIRPHSIPEQANMLCAKIDDGCEVHPDRYFVDGRFFEVNFQIVVVFR
jgi:hypothetical protein